MSSVPSVLSDATPDEAFTVARRDGGELVVRVLSASRLESGPNAGDWSIEVQIPDWRAGLVLTSQAKTRRGAIGDVRRTIARKQDQLLVEILAGHLHQSSLHVSPEGETADQTEA